MVVAFDPGWTPVIAYIFDEMFQCCAPVASEIYLYSLVKIFGPCQLMTRRIRIERFPGIFLM